MDSIDHLSSEIESWIQDICACLNIETSFLSTKLLASSLFSIALESRSCALLRYVFE